MQVINHSPYSVTSLEDNPHSKKLFSQVIQRLNEAGINYSLGSGTALGIYRDGDLIPTDTDLDFMVFDAQGVRRIKEVFSDFTLAVEVIEDDKVQQLAYFHQNIVIDFHFYRFIDGMYECKHQAGVLRFLVSGFIELDSPYGQCQMIENVESMLVSEYGSDWHIPQYRKKGMFKKYHHGLVFGCFDPLHFGHIRLFRRCLHHCEVLSVVVRSDEHIMKYKKRSVFIPQAQRVEDVKMVIPSVYSDTGSKGFLSFKLWTKKLKPDVFFASVENEGKINVGVPVLYMPRTEGVSSSLIRSTLEGTV